MGTEWHLGVGRHAHLCVFAYHPLAGTTADHMDPSQWVLYVTAAECLPPSKRIALATVRSLASAAVLFATVEKSRLGRSGVSPGEALQKSR